MDSVIRLYIAKKGPFRYTSVTSALHR